ncbi:MAG: oligosaccharide flippase family protein [Verrucomicrobiales bacterium]
MLIARIRALLPRFLQTRITEVLASPIGGRLARGAFWSLLGTTLSKVCSTVSWIIVGRMLGKENFGELNMVQSTVGLFGAAAGLGMGMAATKYVAEYKKTDPDRAGRFIGLASATTWIASMILALVLVVIAPWLARETLGAPHLAPYLVISSLLLLFSGIAGAQSGTLAGFESFKAIAKINVIVGVLSFPILLLGAVLGDVTGALWALIASAVLNCLLNYLQVRRSAASHLVAIRYRGCLAESKVFWDCNLPGIVNAVSCAAVAWALAAMLVRHSSNFGDLGIYNAVQRMKLIPENIAAMLLAPMIPILSDTFARNDMHGFGKTLVFSYSIATLTIVPLALLQIAAPWLTLLPFGPEFKGGEPIVLWVMVATISYALLWPMGNILISMGRNWFALFVGTIHNVLSLGLAWWLIPKMGGAGLALAIATSFIVANLPCIIFLHRSFPKLEREVRWCRMCALTTTTAIICALAARYLGHGLALTIGLLTTVSFGLLWLHSAHKTSLGSPYIATST